MTQEALALPRREPLIRAPVPMGWLDELPPVAECLRPYQRAQLEALAQAIDAGHSRILAQAPTGAGKTHQIAAIAAAARLAGLRVLILATRSRLVRQLHERLQAFDVPHGVIAAPLPELRNHSAPVQVASVDTLHRRADVMPLPAADVVIFDEAHLAAARTRIALLERYPDAVRIGFTATPARKSGRGLGAAFDALVPGPSVRELTAAGVLVPTKLYSSPIVTENELREIPRDSDSDYRAGALGELLSRPKLIGDVVENWSRIAHGRRTIVFAVNKAHGAALLESFRRQGIAAEMLTDADEETTREEIIARLEGGTTTVLVNCFLMSYGVDIPSVECIVLARPTRSVTMYLQMVGRGLRASPGKTHCLVIDHGHVIENLGLPQADREWSLSPDSNVNVEARRATDRAIETPRPCPECAAIWLTSEQGRACPECGWMPPQRAKAITTQEADLEEIAETEAPLSIHDPRVERFFIEACGWYRQRWPDRWQQKPNSGRWWAWLQTRDKFAFHETARIPSAFWEAAPIPASLAVAGWLKSRLIRYARARAKRAA